MGSGLGLGMLEWSWKGLHAQGHFSMVATSLPKALGGSQGPQMRTAAQGIIYAGLSLVSICKDVSSGTPVLAQTAS